MYAKRPFAGPAQVLDYLGHYTHRVAISNERLLGLADGRGRFRWRDYADGDRLKIMDLAADEFLRRFLLHVVPERFVRIRHFGFLANRVRRTALARCRALLHHDPEPRASTPESVPALLMRLTGLDIERCAVCGHGRPLRSSSCPDPRPAPVPCRRWIHPDAPRAPPNGAPRSRLRAPLAFPSPPLPVRRPTRVSFSSPLAPHPSARSPQSGPSACRATATLPSPRRPRPDRIPIGPPSAGFSPTGSIRREDRCARFCSRGPADRTLSLCGTPTRPRGGDPGTRRPTRSWSADRGRAIMVADALRDRRGDHAGRDDRGGQQDPRPRQAAAALRTGSVTETERSRRGPAANRPNTEGGLQV